MPHLKLASVKARLNWRRACTDMRCLLAGQHGCMLPLLGEEIRRGSIAASVDVRITSAENTFAGGGVIALGGTIRAVSAAGAAGAADPVARKNN